MASNVNGKNRRKAAPFTGIPKALMDTTKYSMLNGWDVKLLLDLTHQYNGHNNGDLCAAWSGGSTFRGMKHRGWRSKGTLYRSLARLLKLGFITTTRKGGKHRPSLYAITWQPIDECRHKETGMLKFDGGVKPTNIPPGTWKDQASN